MAISNVQPFLRNVVNLPSFPLFCGYLLMVFSTKWYRKYVKPIELKNTLVIYNLMCSLLAVTTLVGFVYGIYDAGAMYLVAPAPNPAVLERVYVLYYYCKVIELMDTVFMVLRHKTRQISVLHVYHHSSMLILSDYTRLYAPWPAIAMPMGLNSFVHVALYLYYALTALYPKSTPPWKQRLTEMQIVQFLIDMVYGHIGYLYHGFCIYGQFYGVGMTYLFGSFYYNAYIKARKPKYDKVDKSGDLKKFN